jgi:hypothetical protein
MADAYRAGRGRCRPALPARHDRRPRDDASVLAIERIQTGVRIERRTLKVLKALAEYLDLSLGDLLEGIVLHAFEGKSPFSDDTLKQVALASRAGKPGAYHATITLAFMALIAERSALGRFDEFDDFIHSNHDLMDKAILNRWSSAERLKSDVARQIFLLPEAMR